MRIPEDEYLDTTLRRLRYRIEGFFEIENRREKSEWERVRWQSTLILNMFAKKGQTIKPKQIAVFPWEEEVKIKPPPGKLLSRQEQLAKFAAYDKKMREKWGKAN